MAGRGPAPKDASQRRRRNEPARGEWVDLPPLDGPVLPPLPDREDGWASRTRGAWDAWRADPATGMFGPAEVQAAMDLAHLYDANVRRGDERFASETRLRADGLGLTAKGKRDLRWRVGEVEDLPVKKKLASVTRLRAVDPQAS